MGMIAWIVIHRAVIPLIIIEGTSRVKVTIRG
jgi:hypothetical protein